MSSPLGTFKRIPPEIREEIWSLLTEDYGQYFCFDTVTDELIRLPNTYSRLPALAETSKTLHTELLDALLLHREAEIYVHPKGFTTNFPVKGFEFEKNHYPWKPLVRFETCIRSSMNGPLTLLQTCISITFNIDVLSPRAPENAIKARKVVASIVHLLNSQPTSHLPHITVQLQVPDGHSLSDCTTNDIAMLVGPFVNLNKKSNGFTITHPPRSTAHQVEVADQCAMIEESAVDEMVASKIAYQQLLLDIKLPLCYTPCHSSDHCYRRCPSICLAGLARTDTQLVKEAKKVLAALEQLESWYEHSKMPKPEWVDALKPELEGGNTMPKLSDALFGRMSGGWMLWDMRNWAAGIFTSQDPFGLKPN